MWFGKKRNSKKPNEETSLDQANRYVSENNDLPSNSRKIIGYHYSVTGYSSYMYYQGEEKLCSAFHDSCPWLPVKMYGYDNEWEFEPVYDDTIVPGLTRFVKDHQTGQNRYKIVYRAKGNYEINDSIMVYCKEGHYALFCDKQLIARICRVMEELDFIPESSWLDIESYFEVNVAEGVDDGLLMLICSFPMLQFAW